MRPTTSDLTSYYKGDALLLKQQIERQRALLGKKAPKRKFYSYDYFVELTTIDPTIGVKAVADNKVGALILAGGVGSRLRFEKPKGCFPIYKGKSLYQIAAEKVQQASTKSALQLAIMTSDLTDKETRVFFQEHNFFGLHPSQVDFFCQKSWPLLDFEGNLFLQSPTELAMGPNGNGETLSLFVQSGIFEKWRALGIEHLVLFPVDNPLAQPFHPAFIAHHIGSHAEISLAVTKKRAPEEKMGVVGLCENKLAVLEYTELTEKQRELFIYGNLAIMLFSMSFIEKIQDVSLPIHVVKKTTKKFTEEKGITFPKESNAYKFEQFIFDLLDYSNRSEAIIFDRANSFAPLKESEGPDGVESVRKALRQFELATSE